MTRPRRLLATLLSVAALGFAACDGPLPTTAVVPPDADDAPPLEVRPTPPPTVTLKEPPPLDAIDTDEANFAPVVEKPEPAPAPVLWNGRGTRPGN